MHRVPGTQDFSTEAGKVQKNRAKLVTLVTRACRCSRLMLLCFSVTCGFWPKQQERKRMTVPQQRSHKLWLSLGCEQDYIPPTVSSFPTLPGHCGGRQTSHSLVGLTSVQIISPYTIKHCWLWFHVERLHLMKACKTLEGRRSGQISVSSQVRFTDSGAGLH